MAKKHYEWRLGEPPPKIGRHSLAKHRILDQYVRRYIEICTAIPVQKRLNLTIVDGYAGGGRYRFNDKDVRGSPIILLETVAEMQDELNRARPKGFDICTDFLFVDLNPQHTGFLRSEIENSPFQHMLDKTIHIWTDDFNSRVSDAIALVKKRSPQTGRSLFVLDQYGWSRVAFRSVRQILDELGKAEIFLTFSVDSLIDYMSEKHSGRRSYEDIGADPDFVREVLSKKKESPEWRSLIQNTLYRHLKSGTGAEYYSPFFIRSPEARRSYWFIHLSRHREARNVIGNIHWQENNISLHHGGAGLQALGFSKGADPRQLTLGYEFDEIARERSEQVLQDQIPRIIRDAVDPDLAPSLEYLFGRRCNDTPVTRELFEKVLVGLRDLGELRIEDAYGSDRPRARAINWSDRIVLARQRTFFGPFGLMGNNN
ncbi:MAG: three-Cys-motif partner protein TcmP [Hyphomonadaceae bacterium]|nr:three-Cys-motif partner protein TcmP [Hyphomonadaceae bacterium]MBC6412404.1 three-Cys-motif partner protein TcmP [Hyphomonadaceae bacterium]